MAIRYSYSKGEIVIRIEFEKLKEIEGVIKGISDDIVVTQDVDDKIEVYIKGIEIPWIRILLTNNLVEPDKFKYPLNLGMKMTWDSKYQEWLYYNGEGLPEDLEEDFLLNIYNQPYTSFTIYKGQFGIALKHKIFIEFDFKCDVFLFILRQSYKYHVGINNIGDSEWIEKGFFEKVKESEKNNNERKRRLKEAPKKPKIKVVTSIQYDRNPDVVAEVLERANGICEYCKAEAPFLRESDGTPYLEVHHEIPLSENGDDTVENAVAICPNCHRKAHYGPH